MADDVLMFDVEPKNQDRLFVVFDKVSSTLEKIITTGKAATVIMDTVKDLHTAATTKTVNLPAEMKADTSGSSKRLGLPDFTAVVPNISKLGSVGEKIFPMIEKTGLAVAGKFGIIVTAITTAIGAVKKMALALFSVPELIQRLAEKVGSYVQYFSPATMQRYNWALEDLWATIGEKLQPILEVFAEIIENLADAISSLDSGRFIQRLAAVIKRLGEVFIELVIALLPVVELIMEALIPALRAFAAILQFITRIFRGVRGFVVDPENDPRRKQNSRVRATQGISVFGVEQASTRALEAAGRIGGRNHMQNIDQNVEQIAGALANGQQAAAAQQLNAEAREAMVAAQNQAIRGVLPPWFRFIF